MLRNRSDHAISATVLQKKSRKLLDHLSEGAADLRIDAMARARAATPRKNFINKKDMDVFVNSL